jgi:hypothetical protein
MQYEIGYKLYRNQLKKIICVPASSFKIVESSVYSPVAYHRADGLYKVHRTSYLFRKQILDANNFYWVLYILYYTFYTRLPTAYDNIVIYSGVYIFYLYHGQCQTFLTKYDLCVVLPEDG